MTRAPSPHTPLGSHARRLNRVIDHVDTHLCDDLRLEHLAPLAAFSPFHLHRLFHCWTGETLRDFVRRRRLETAGIRLHHEPGLSILEIALSCGFSSAETFSRSFRQHFGLSPSAWRGHPSLGSQAGTQPIDIGQDLRLESVALRSFPAREVLYWRARGDYADMVDSLWARFLPWVRSIGLENQPLLGMGLDDPAITAARHQRYDTCVVLPESWQDRACLLSSRKRVEGGWYACLAFSAERIDIGAAWSWLLKEWLPGSGFTAGTAPFFEAYPESQERREQRRGEALLCMPVLPLAR
jgi:AraC family transcriptional regulator